MSQLAGAAMGMVHQQVLEEEDRILDGQEFHGNKEFVSTEDLALLPTTV